MCVGGWGQKPGEKGAAYSVYIRRKHSDCTCEAMGIGNEAGGIKGVRTRGTVWKVGLLDPPTPPVHESCHLHC